MKILLFGSTGQVGSALLQALNAHHQVIALTRCAGGHSDQNYACLSAQYCGDLSNLAGIQATILAIQPDVVINAAAYTQVDLAESEPELADLINHQAVKIMAQTCASINALLLHYSTDYVFDGQNSHAYTEQDVASPLNVYGQTKLAGEQAIAQAVAQEGCRAIILRTCWVYGVHGHNFVASILKLAQKQMTLTVINDQFAAPTSARLIAQTTADILKIYAAHAQPEQLYGLYHLTAQGRTCWFDYAGFIVDQARIIEQNQALELKLKVDSVLAISSADYAAKELAKESGQTATKIALRPLNSQLNVEKIQQTFKLTLPDWQDELKVNLALIVNNMANGLANQKSNKTVHQVVAHQVAANHDNN